MCSIVACVMAGTLTYTFGWLHARMYCNLKPFCLLPIHRDFLCNLSNRNVTPLIPYESIAWLLCTSLGMNYTWKLWTACKNTGWRNIQCSHFTIRIYMYFKKPVFQQGDSLLRWLWEKKTIGINMLKHETIQLQTTNNATQTKQNKSHWQNIFQKLQTAVEKNRTVKCGNKKHVHHKGGGQQSSMVQIRNTPWNKCKWCCHNLTFILLMWRIWWDPNNASKWQMGFNSAFKGLNMAVTKTEHIKSKTQTRVWARSFNNTIPTNGAIKNSRNATSAPLASGIFAAKLFLSQIHLIICAYMHELSITDCMKCTKSASSRKQKLSSCFLFQTASKYSFICM